MQGRREELMERPSLCGTPVQENIMNYLKIFVLGAALVVPAAVSAQQDRRQSDQQVRHYEDKAHNDSHEWNTNENDAYRRYLQEHHKKYNDFAKAKQSEQANYWNWRHSNPDGDRH
jgi:ribulose kinase